MLTAVHEGRKGSAWEATYWVPAQLLATAGGPAAGAARKASARALETYRAQRLLAQQQPLRQPQLHRKAWARLLLGVLGRGQNLQANF